MKTVAILSIGIAVMLASPGSSLGMMNVPYFEDLESAALGDFASQSADAWQLVFFGTGPTVSNDKAFSGDQSLTDPGAGAGMVTNFTGGALTADQAGISFMWSKGDWGGGGEDDRVRLDVFNSMEPLQYSGTVVIWDGFVLNDQNLWGEPNISDLSLNTWYKFEMLFDRKDDDSGYEEYATVNVYNADGSLYGTMPFRMGLGSRVIPEEIASFAISFRGGRDIFIDDISIPPGGEYQPPDCNPGDADDDGDVDDDDLSLLLANWGSETATCAQGEFSETPPVNDDDLSLLLANWTGALPAAVPEPATLVLLIPAAVLIRRGRE